MKRLFSEFGKRLLLVGALFLPAQAAPIISGTFAQDGGAVGIVPISATGGSTRIARLGNGGGNPANNIATIESNAGLPAGTLTTLLPGAHRAGVLSAVFTGGLIGDSIEFDASQIQLVALGSPSFAYFVALDPLFGSLPTVFQPLTLGLLPQTFSVVLPADGDYRFTFGAVRTNPTVTINVPFLGQRDASSYSTTAYLSNVQGVDRVPELDAGAATLPLLFVSGLLLAGRRRRAV